LDFEVSILNVQAEVSFSWHDEAAHRLLLNDNVGLLLGLNVNLSLGLDVCGLLLDNNDRGALGTHVVDLLIVEHRLDHDVTSTATLEHKLNSVLAGTSFAEETESYVGVTEGLRVKQVIVTNFDMNIFAELVQLLYRDFHELTLPVGVLSSIVTDGGSPFLSFADLDPCEGIHFVKETATLDFEVSILNVETEVSFSWHDEAHRLLLLNDNVGLRLDECGLLLDNNMGLGLVDDNDTRAAMMSSHEFRSHVDEATGVELDSLFTRSLLGENAEGNVCLTDGLHGVTLVLDDNVHVVLEHVGGDLHELKSPSGFFASMVAGLGVEDLLADFDVDEGGHLVEGSSNFVVEVGVQNVKLKDSVVVHIAC